MDETHSVRSNNDPETKQNNPVVGAKRQEQDSVQVQVQVSEVFFDKSGLKKQQIFEKAVNQLLEVIFGLFLIYRIVNTFEMSRLVKKI